MKKLLYLYRRFLQTNIESQSEAHVHTDLCSKEIQTTVFGIKSGSPLHEASSQKMLEVLDTPLHSAAIQWSLQQKYLFLFLKCLLSRERSNLLYETK